MSIPLSSLCNHVFGGMIKPIVSIGELVISHGACTVHANADAYYQNHVQSDIISLYYIAVLYRCFLSLASGLQPLYHYVILRSHSITHVIIIIIL